MTKENLLENFKWENSVRDAIFHFRFLLFRLFLSPIVPADYKNGHPFLPGLEMYKTIEFAKNSKSKIEYLGGALNPSSTRAIKLETGLNFLVLLKRLFFDIKKIGNWDQDLRTYHSLLSQHSLGDIGEFLDHIDINTINGIFEHLAPEQKDIIIDRANEKILKTVIHSDFKKGVLLVNLLNMP